MNYSLYNKTQNKYLIHPKYGLWTTDNKPDAEEMLISCKQYIESLCLSTTLDIEVVELDKTTTNE